MRLLFVFPVLLCALSPFVQAATLRFTDVTADANLAFTHATTIDHQSGPMVAGGAIGDFNLDGYPDLFVLGGGGRADALFINNRDSTFTDRAADRGLNERHRGVGATMADFDGDGDDDLYVTSFGAVTEVAGPGRHRLYRNEGDYFVNVSVDAGVATTTTTHPDGYGAAFGDYDRDGDMDLFVGAWHSAPVLGARLFQNQGDGTFVNVTQDVGVITGGTSAFGAIWSDMDGDRYPELLVAGDFGTNRYYRNNTDGTFQELDPGSGQPVKPEPPLWSISKAFNAMGATVGDFNRDGLNDWFVTAIWPTAGFANDFWGNGLYLNHGDHIFTEIAQGAGVHDGGWGWGTDAADFDHDGWTDLVMTNGWPIDDTTTGASFTGERAYLWRNDGDLTFTEMGVEAGLTHTGEGRTLLTFDYDLDGDRDIVILSCNEPLQLFRNDLITTRRAPDDAHWLQVRLDTSRHRSLAPHGIGARITVVAGGVSQTRQMTSGGTYLGQSELVAHFGLHTNRSIEELTVDWGGGHVTRRHHLKADRRITLRPRCRTLGSDGSLSPYPGRWCF